MEFTIREYGTYQSGEVLALYKAVGWTNYTQNPQMLQQAFAHSLKIWAAFDGETLAGLIRVVGDGASIIYIQDLLVRPEYQRKGIGTALMKKILDEYAGVYQKCLAADDTEKTAAFYRSLGFEQLDDWGCCGFIRND